MYSCLNKLIMMNCLCSDDLNYLLVNEFVVHDDLIKQMNLNPILDDDVL